MKATRLARNLDDDESSQSRETGREAASASEINLSVPAEDFDNQQKSEETKDLISGHRLRPRKRGAIQQSPSFRTRKRKRSSNPHISVDTALKQNLEEDVSQDVPEEEQAPGKKRAEVASQEDNVDDTNSCAILRPKTDEEQQLGCEQINRSARLTGRRQRMYLQKRLREERKNQSASYPAVVTRMYDERFQFPKIRSAEEWASLHAQQEAEASKKHEEWSKWFDESSDSESERGGVRQAFQKSRRGGSSKQKTKRKRT